METIEYNYKNLDKSEFGNGEWLNEPDKKQWVDQATSLPCLAVRHPSMGHWCGYVGLPSSHPLYGKDYQGIDVGVHGGLTFAGKCQKVSDESMGICHKAPHGEDDVWWLGFDCAHADDLSPISQRLNPFIGHTGTYKSLQYVEKECAYLARQLADKKEITKLLGSE